MSRELSEDELDEIRCARRIRIFRRTLLRAGNRKNPGKNDAPDNVWFRGWHSAPDY